MGWRSTAAAAMVAMLLPAGCGCSNTCENSVQFSFGAVMRTVPLGSVATACVGTTCQAQSPDQETAKIYVSDEDVESEVETSLTVRDRDGQVRFERKAPLELKSHKSGRFCPTDCRTGAIEYRP